MFYPIFARGPSWWKPPKAHFHGPIRQRISDKGKRTREIVLNLPIFVKRNEDKPRQKLLEISQVFKEIYSPDIWVCRLGFGRYGLSIRQNRLMARRGLFIPLQVR